MWWVWLLGAWGTGWFTHNAIVWYGWWNGRLYWKADDHCSCDDCKSFRCYCSTCCSYRTNGNWSSTHPTKGPHSVPHMLELPQVIGLTIGGFFVWWGFLVCETYDFLFKSREAHLEYLKKRNRPIEEVFKELNQAIEEGSAETEKQVNEFVDKMQKQRSA